MCVFVNVVEPVDFFFFIFSCHVNRLKQPNGLREKQQVPRSGAARVCFEMFFTLEVSGLPQKQTAKWSVCIVPNSFNVQSTCPVYEKQMHKSDHFLLILAIACY